MARRILTFRAAATVSLASGAFGGAIGALATAAARSQANPDAITAAIQRVQDTKAEQRLATVSRELSALDAASRPTIGTALFTIETDLALICRNTEQTAASSSSFPPGPEVCPSQPALAGDARAK